MISYVKTTTEGYQLASNWNGDNSNKLNYFEATLLACAIEGSTLRDLSKAINENYPFKMETSAVAAKAIVLQRRGLMYVEHAIEETTSIIVIISGIKVKTTVGEFANLNHYPIKDLIDALGWKSEFHGIINGTSISIRHA